jgi:uncharacterized membrane protein
MAKLCLSEQRWGLIIGIILLATLLRWPFLAAQSIAFDESFSLVVGSAAWSLLFQAILSDGVHPPLFYVLHKGALALFGNSEFGQRFMAAVFSLLGLPLLYQLGRRLFNPGVGLGAMLLLALNPLHIWLAQEARMYSLLNALMTLSMLFFWEALQHNSRSAWLKLTLTNALIFWIHYFGLLGPIIQLGYIILTFQHHHRYLRPWALSQIGAGVLLLPWLLATFFRPVQSFGIGFLMQPTLADLPLSLWNLTTGINDFGGLAILTLLSFGAAWGAALFFRPRLTRATMKRPYLLLLSWGFIPPLLVWLMSQRRSFYADRYLSFCIPALVLLAAYGVSRLPTPLQRRALAAGLVVATMLGLMVMFQAAAYQKDNWRSAAAYVGQHEQPGDAILLRSLHIKFAFDYYYEGQADTLPVTMNIEEFEIDPLVVGKKRAWLIFPYTRRPTHYPMQPLTAEDVWNLETSELPFLRRWFFDHKANIIDSQRFLGVQVWLIDLGS